MSDQSEVKVCVIGAGAIGGYLGVRLADSGAKVSVLARGKTLQSIQTRGWILEEGDKRLVAKVNATSDPQALGVQDVVIVAVKAHSLADIAPLVTSLCHEDTMVIPAINGIPWWFSQGMADFGLPSRLDSVDPDGTIEKAIDSKRVIGSVVYPSCYSPEPGVSHHSSGTRLVLGEIGVSSADSKQTDRLERVVALFNAAGLAAEPTDEIRRAVWEKLLGNVCFNPVSLLTGSSTDLMIDDPDIYRMFVDLMNEVIAVGSALGLAIGVTPEARLATTRKLGNVKTSMLQDAEAARPVEVQAIVGAFVEVARSLGVETPIASTIYALARMRAQTFGLLKQ